MQVNLKKKNQATFPAKKEEEKNQTFSTFSLTILQDNNNSMINQLLKSGFIFSVFIIYFATFFVSLLCICISGKHMKGPEIVAFQRPTSTMLAGTKKHVS